MRNRIKFLLPIVFLASLPSLSYGQKGTSNSGKGGLGGGGMSAPGGMGGDGGEYGGSGGPPSLAFNLDGKSFRATRVLSFDYVVHSFRPKMIAIASGGMTGAASGYGEGGGYGNSGLSGPGGNGSEGTTSPEGLTILAFLFDGEKVNDRTRIEITVFSQPNNVPGGYPGGGMYGGSMGGYGGSEGGMAGGMGGMGMDSEPWEMQPFASLGKVKSKFQAKLADSEINLVSDIIRQTIWKDDVLKELRNSKGQGESASPNEKLLKQLLAEQYDTQLARQEMEADSIKQRLETLLEELKRRRLAKDRVVEVQLGRLILDAQGLLNTE